MKIKETKLICREHYIFANGDEKCLKCMREKEVEQFRKEGSWLINEVINQTKFELQQEFNNKINELEWKIEKLESEIYDLKHK